MFHDDSEDDEEEPDAIDNSLDNYLLMSDKMRQRDYDLANPKAALEWWSVSYTILINQNSLKLRHAN
jgi:Fe-S cluster biosynthesis and repair protein YggX